MSETSDMVAYSILGREIDMLFFINVIDRLVEWFHRPSRRAIARSTMTGEWQARNRPD